MSKFQKEAYGLLLRQTNRYGTDYIIAEVVKRNDEGKVRNCSNSFIFDLPKHLQNFQLEGLCIDGFVSDQGEHKFLGCKPRYRDVYSVDTAVARRMVKTLNKIESLAIKHAAYEPEDWFECLCDALKLSFVVESRDKHQASNYDDNKWDWMTTYEGRNRFRQLISNAVEAAKAAKESVA